jgi:hypothetical protein
MAPAMAATQFRLHSGREQETHRVSPARSGRCPVDRLVREQQRPAPDPAGEKRPPWAGRALAGALALGWRGGNVAAWQRRWPLPWVRGTGGNAWHHLPPHLRAGTGNAPPFPRPCGTARQRPSHPAQRRPAPDPAGEKRAAQGRGGRWPGALAPGGRRGSVAAWQRRWPLPWRRWAGGTDGITFRPRGLSGLDFLSAAPGPSCDRNTGSGRYRYRTPRRRKPGAARHIQMRGPLGFGRCRCQGLCRLPHGMRPGRIGTGVSVRVGSPCQGIARHGDAPGPNTNPGS